MLNGLLSIAQEVASALQLVRTVLIIVEAVLAIAIVITIFFQPANTTGVSALDNAETYYTKNKKRSTEGMMKRATVILGIIMAVVAIAFFITLCFDRTGVTA
ncbi:MAG: preprotein translocase subunit SecG [Clostridia bacterium]|nr:preprotein translocase subunit SecG [Clostridia bacterium]